MFLPVIKTPAPKTNCRKHLHQKQIAKKVSRNNRKKYWRLEFQQLYRSSCSDDLLVWHKAQQRLVQMSRQNRKRHPWSPLNHSWHINSAIKYNHIYNIYNIMNLKTYLIFVIFFTQPQFDAWKFYTWKCVNLRQKLPNDKTA